VDRREIQRLANVDLTHHNRQKSGRDRTHIFSRTLNRAFITKYTGFHGGESQASCIYQTNSQGVIRTIKGCVSQNTTMETEMNEEMVTQMMAATERLAAATETLERVLGDWMRSRRC